MLHVGGDLLRRLVILRVGVDVRVAEQRVAIHLLPDVLVILELKAEGCIVDPLIRRLRDSSTG